MRVMTVLVSLVTGFVAGAAVCAAHVYPQGLSRQDVIGLSRYDPNVGGLVPTALGEQFPGIVDALAALRASPPPAAPSGASTTTTTGAIDATPQSPSGCEQELAQCRADQEELLSDICPSSSAAANP